MITGAASGIGAAIARRFVDAGAHVGLLARRADRLSALTGELGTGVALSVPADVTDSAALAQAAETISQALGNADIVVANAGVMLPSPLEELRADEWQRMVDLNLTGVLHTTQAFLRNLLAAGEARGVADLVLVSSLGARVTFPGYAVYGATKAAVSYLAAAWRPSSLPGVRVTAVEPGLTHSELAGHVAHPVQAQELAGMFEMIPALGSDDVADAVTRVVALPAHASVPTLPILPARQA